MTTRRNKGTITIPKDKLPSKPRKKKIVIPKKKIENAIRPKAVAKPKPKMKLNIISKDDPANKSARHYRIRQRKLEADEKKRQQKLEDTEHYKRLVMRNLKVGDTKRRTTGSTDFDGDYVDTRKTRSATIKKFTPTGVTFIDEMGKRKTLSYKGFNMRFQ